MNYTRLPIPDRLVSVKEAILTVLEDVELRTLFARRGYPEEELKFGLSLQETAVQLFQARFVQYGRGVNATKELKAQVKRVRGIAAAHRSAARSALGGEQGLFDQLRLNEHLVKDRDNMLMQVRHFYTALKCLPQVQVHLAPYGLIPEVIESSIQQVEVLEKIMQEQQHKKGSAKAITVQRNRAIAELDDWTLQFFGTARLLFRKQKAQLNKLGL